MTTFNIRAASACMSQVNTDIFIAEVEHVFNLCLQEAMHLYARRVEYRTLIGPFNFGSI
jgi:hypothetical protein